MFYFVFALASQPFEALDRAAPYNTCSVDSRPKRDGLVRTLDVSDGVVVTPPTNFLAVWSISEAIYR